MKRVIHLTQKPLIILKRINTLDHEQSDKCIDFTTCFYDFYFTAIAFRSSKIV